MAEDFYHETWTFHTIFDWCGIDWSVEVAAAMLGPCIALPIKFRFNIFRNSLYTYIERHCANGRLNGDNWQYKSRIDCSIHRQLCSRQQIVTQIHLGCARTHCGCLPDWHAHQERNCRNNHIGWQHEILFENSLLTKKRWKNWEKRFLLGQHMLFITPFSVFHRHRYFFHRFRRKYNSPMRLFTSLRQPTG